MNLLRNRMQTSLQCFIKSAWNLHPKNILLCSKLLLRTAHHCFIFDIEHFKTATDPVRACLIYIIDDKMQISYELSQKQCRGVHLILNSVPISAMKSLIMTMNENAYFNVCLNSEHSPCST